MNRRTFLHQSCWAATVICSSTWARGDETPAQAPLKPHFVPRDGLPNCRLRFERDKAGRVAFLGGSITHMEGWRTMVCRSLSKRFPPTKFDFIDAGIPSTDTAMAPFRLERDVFMNGRVDLLFVEFAVNDHTNGRNAAQSIRGMEGVVRQARRRNPEIDIVMLHFIDYEKLEMLRNGKDIPTIAAHEKVAAHYGIPSIDLAREAAAGIAAGSFTWPQFGGTHPKPFGHRLYADAIDALLDAQWSSPLPADAAPRAHPLPDKPLDAFNYERGRLVDIAEAKLVNGWKTDPCWKPAGGQTRPGFVGVPMLTADQPGATLKLTFTGTAVGVIVPAGPDAGILEFSIDGKDFRTVDQFTRWSAKLHIPWSYILADDLKDGPHELTLRTSAAKNPASRGHACRIVHFAVN